MPRTTAARPLLVVAAAVTIALAGCVPEPDPGPTPTHEPSALFGSEEEALAAAEEAYAAYQAASNQAIRAGDPSGLEKVATGAALVDATDSVAQYVDDGLTLSGETVVASVQLVDESWRGTSASDIRVLACLDLTQVTVRDASGEATHEPHERLLPTVATLEWRPDRSGLVVASEDGWAGDSDCD